VVLVTGKGRIITQIRRKKRENLAVLEEKLVKDMDLIIKRCI